MKLSRILIGIALLLNTGAAFGVTICNYTNTTVSCALLQFHHETQYKFRTRFWYTINKGQCESFSKRNRAGYCKGANGKWWGEQSNQSFCVIHGQADMVHAAHRWDVCNQVGGEMLPRFKGWGGEVEFTWNLNP